MISVIKVTDGSFNVIGTDNGMFVLQGNLTKEQLMELKREITKALKS
jgi:ABC-type transporter Mla MlaB component